MKKNYSFNPPNLCTEIQSVILHEYFTFPDRGWTFGDRFCIQEKAASH